MGTMKKRRRVGGLLLAADDLVVVRFGGAGTQRGANGTQVAKVIAIDDDRAGLTVQKWLDAGARWANQRWIPARDLRGKPEKDDERAARARASMTRA
jgi:hypothetical protein